MPKIFIQKNLQSNPDTAAYSRFITGIRPQISRTLGDVANLSVVEQEAAMGLLPNEYDNSETKAAALSNFYEFIVERVSANNGLSKEEAARQIGLYIDPSTGRITSDNIEKVRRGEVIRMQDSASNEWKQEASRMSTEDLKRIAGESQ